MDIFRTVSDLKSQLQKQKKSGLKLGFVPTMGALHSGHLSLISFSLKENDFTIVSIFVNPTQFNEKSDLEKYPRPFENDITLLNEAGVDLLFYPDLNEIYPDSPDRSKINADFGPLSNILEAAKRPGHFEGVVQVVKRLLDIVQPDTLYLGQKDYQQYLIIRKMILLFNIPVQIKLCPIIREKDGLAMSSRNVNLTETERRVASKLYKSLKLAKELYDNNFPVGDIKTKAVDFLNKEPLIDTEYFEITDRELMPLEWNQSKGIIACSAIRIGKVRLIDNLIIC